MSSVSYVAVPAMWGMICSKPNITENSGNGHIHYLLMLSSSLSSGEEIRHALEKLAIFPVCNVYTRRKHVDYQDHRIWSNDQRSIVCQMKRMAPASSEEGCYRQ